MERATKPNHARSSFGPQCLAGLAVLLGVGLHGAHASATTKIACVGASTTSGDGSDPGHHYPDELQRLVAPGAEVQNFGVSGTTMLRNVSASYWKTPMLAQALAYAPDVVIIWFGGNDAKPENWTTHKSEFLGDYEAMIDMFQALPSHPRTYVVLSLVTHDTEGIPKMVVDDEVVPLCRQAAADTGSRVVDVHDDLADHPEYFPDGIHPDDMGTIAVAQLVYDVLTAPPGVGGADASAPPAADGGAPDSASAGPPEVRGAEVGGAGAALDAASAPDSSFVSTDGASGGASAGNGGGADAAAPHSAQSAARSGGCDVVGRPSPRSLASFGILLLIVAAVRRPSGRRRSSAREARARARSRRRRRPAPPRTRGCPSPSRRRCRCG